MAGVIGTVFKRNFHVSRALKAGGVEGYAASAGDHKGGVKLWRNISLFGAVPAIILCMINAYLKHQEEAHLPPPEFVPYEYLRVRTKRFPWGDGNHSLFHNPHVNPLPTGYEHADH